MSDPIQTTKWLIEQRIRHIGAHGPRDAIGTAVDQSLLVELRWLLAQVEAAERAHADELDRAAARERNADHAATLDARLGRPFGYRIQTGAAAGDLVP